METIVKHIEKLEELFRQMKNISSIERDLILEKLRNVYDIILLEKVKSVPAIESIEQHTETSRKTEKVSPAEVDEKIQEQETKQDEIATEEILPVDDIKIKEPEKVIQTRTGIDLFSIEASGTKAEQKELVVDKISKDQNMETIADKFQKNKIASLKDAIGINEKFFFINELFSGELSVYNQSIEKLDQLETEAERNQFISNLIEKFEWDIESDAFLKLQDFVLKKYTS
ncbi:MAG: hypothetical protein R2750_06865 [Bacteroidales bacterium]